MFKYSKYPPTYEIWSNLPKGRKRRKKIDVLSFFVPGNPNFRVLKDSIDSTFLKVEKVCKIRTSAPSDCFYGIKDNNTLLLIFQHLNGEAYHEEKIERLSVHNNPWDEFVEWIKEY